jgi:anti-sigma factor RsiW
MSCEETKNNLHAYLDGELDVVRSVEFEEHLKGCPACSRAHQEYRSLRAAMASPSLYFDAPRSLERKVRSAVRKVACAKTARPVWRWTWNWKLEAWFAPFAAAALVTVVTFHFWTQHWTRDQRVQEVLSAHVHSLMVDHLTDVASSDQHTVKPWFTGKLNFSPIVIDPAAEGFPLIGGRLDYVADSPTAAVVYQRRKHYINLFISPANQTASTKEDRLTRHGYNLSHWLQGGMEYWAVSDVNKGDLQQFVQLVRREAPAEIVR